jgi:hypothetical protein
VKYIRCDDSGENKALFDACQAQGYGVKFEFSGPRTPQRNGKVERKFQTFFGRIRAMLNSAGLKDHLRSGVWAECAMTVTYLSNITSINEKMICPNQLLFRIKPRLPESLRSFGEVGVVTTKKDIQGKLTNRGTPCMFMGYSNNHAHDVYRMLNIKTKKIINSRDIIWMNTFYKNWTQFLFLEFFTLCPSFVRFTSYHCSPPCPCLKTSGPWKRHPDHPQPRDRKQIRRSS